jgi:hypothetical protein
VCTNYFFGSLCFANYHANDLKQEENHPQNYGLTVDFFDGASNKHTNSFSDIQYALIRSNYNKTSMCNTHNTTIYNDFKSIVLLQICHKKRI